jgi:hypothetical protein
MKVVLLKGQSQYGVLRCHIDEAEKAFAARGDSVAVIDVQEPGVMEHLAEHLAAQRPADLVFSIGIYGEFADAAGRTIRDLTGAPHVVLYVDFPLCHFARLDHVPTHSAVLAIDASHVRAINSYYGPGRFAYVGLCPLPALGEPQPLPDTAEAFLAARPIPVFCPMTYYPPVPPPWQDYPEPTRSIITEAVERALSEEWLPPLEALDRWFAERGLDLTDPALREQMAPVRLQSVLINNWVRDVRRQKLFEAAAKVGLPLSVDGNGFEHIEGRFKNITNLGSGDTRNTQQQMGRARMVLSHNANFGEGMHDRAATAMIAGAATITDTSQYVRDHYAPGRDLALFRWQHLEEDLAAIKALLDDGDALYAMAKAGQQKAMTQDRWEHRIGTILTAAAAVGQ